MADILQETKPIARVWFMNVGNGDCTVVIDDETRSALVVDCPSSHVSGVKSLLEREQATLDTCVVTHWDADHYGGIARLAVDLPARRVLYNHDTLFDSDDSPPYAVKGALKNFLNIPNPSDTLAPASAGSEGSFGRVSWRMLAPNHHELTMAYVSRRRNVASAVMDVSLPSLRIIIGGDAVAATWQRLFTESLEADILRWPHHGADLAGDDSGLISSLVAKAVGPKYVIVSAGSSNTYGHPSASVIHDLSSHSSVLCTQVTAGCFGFLERNDRNAASVRAMIARLGSTHCAGSVRVECYEDSYIIDPSRDDHQSRIGEWPNPMCRFGAAGLIAEPAVEAVVEGNPGSR